MPPPPPPPTPTHPKIRVIESHVECQSKGNHQEEGEEEESTEGVEDVDEHDNVDSGEGEFSDEDDEINPAQEDCNGSQLPLPLAEGRTKRGWRRGRWRLMQVSQSLPKYEIFTVIHTGKKIEWQLLHIMSKKFIVSPKMRG